MKTYILLAILFIAAAPAYHINYDTHEITQVIAPIEVLEEPTHLAILINAHQEQIEEHEVVFCQTCNNTIPYHRLATEILLTNLATQEETRINTQEHARICGNNICNQGYNAITCPQDCAEEEPTSYNWRTGSIIALLLIIAFGLILRKKQKK